MKKLIAFLAIALCCPIYGQNIEHQIVASQYGAFKVPTVGNGFAFPPDSCQVSGGGKNFPAFTAGVPIKVVDTNPAQIEVDTPVAVNLNNSNCSVSMTTTYQHTSFYLTSGTGGLQEALNSGQVTGGANTVILDQQWYSQVSPSTPATVIAAVKGSTLLGIVDVTTSPYTYYSWSGSAYQQIAPPGSLPAGTGVVKVVSGNGSLATPGTDYVLPTGNISGTSANLSGTPALPNGTTGTTQATGPCDNSGKLATDQFVVTCAGTASFPNTNGIVVNTSPSASRTGVVTDLTTLFGGVSTTNLQVLTSTPPPPSGPTTKSCEMVNGGTVSSVGCTWNTAPAAGETIACTVFGASGNTITLADSATNTYTPFGAGHTNSAISTFMRTFYTAPITAPVTTETATLSVSSFQPGILCNTVNGIAPSSPQDGQVVIDSTTAPVTTGALTTTQNGDYIFCTGVGAPGSGFGTGGGFTLGAQFSPFFDSINQYTVQATAGSISPSITGSVTTSASLMCSAFKASSGPSIPSTVFTSAAPFVSDNVTIINIREWGAVGDGSSHPACTYLGLGSLGALQAYRGGIYSFATSCNNQMDWLATQYAVNKLTGSGGTVKAAAGTYVWDQTVIWPVGGGDASAGNLTAIYLVGDGEGGTLIVPSTGDFGASSAMASCGPPNAAPQDNSGAGSGRYASAACYSGFVDLTFYNPYIAGYVNVTDTSYARGVINVPAPKVGSTGLPVQMDGIVMGGRTYMHRVGAWGFRMGFNVVGDHMTWDQIFASQDMCGMYWAPESIYLQGDIVMQGHNFTTGNGLAGFCVDKDAQFNLYQSGELYVGGQPYGWIKFPGVTDAYLGSGYFPFFTEGNYDQIQAESTGNAVIWDDNLTNSAGGVNVPSGSGQIILPQFKSIFATWGTAITTGGRNQYAWIGAGQIMGLSIKNPFSNSGSFLQGGSGQIAGILAQFTGAGGGIEITGDITDALFSGYTSLPLVGNTRFGGYCSPVGLYDPGKWQGTEVFLDATVTSIAKGQALMMLSDGNVGIANGTSPVIGISAQSFANPGTGQCLAIITSGNVMSPYSMSTPGTSTNGNLLVSASSGTGAVLGAAGGYVIGNVINGGVSTAPQVVLNGMGGYVSPTTTWTSCTMSTSTTCTATVPSGATSCTATLQGTGTVIGGECSITSTTATVTAASSNSAVWAIAAH